MTLSLEMLAELLKVVDPGMLVVVSHRIDLFVKEDVC
jgi:hypothetical protein